MSYCLYCGKEIKEKSHNKNGERKYCNMKCLKAARGDKEYKTAVCMYCGKEFKETPSRPNKFCSRSCSALYQGFVAALERESELKHNPETVDELNHTFEKLKRLKEKLDKERQCRWCGKWFVDGKRFYCSEECSRKADNHRRDKRLETNGKADWSITLPRVFDKFNGICQACGKHLSFDIPTTSNNYPSIDHIKPISKGGLHRWDNVQLLCRGCNTKKSNKWDE